MTRPSLLALALAVAGCNGRAALLTQPPDVRDVPSVATGGLIPSSHSSVVHAASAGGAIDCSQPSQAREYEIGPGKKYAAIADVPWEALAAGETVRLFWRPEPYREKVMLSAVGTPTAPVRVCGVPGPHGELPVIDGENATTRPGMDFPYDGHQPRGLVIVGHAHKDPVWERTPSYILLQGLEIRNASPPNTFTNKAGKVVPYSDIATGIFVERAAHLTIRGCIVTANNNGIFIGTGGGPALSHDILLEGNFIHGNGSLTRYYEHNVYNEASNVVYQYNHFGPPRGGAQGVLGANIKERSAGVVIRYNWIEDGAHILDIVDAQEAQATTVPMPSFHSTFVYGNVIVRGRTPSGSMIHYGGDSGVLPTYRKGTLFFYDNTVIVRNDTYPEWARTPFFELSTNDEHLDSRNNVFWSAVPPTDSRPVGMLGARDNVTSGKATFSHDWIRDGIRVDDLSTGSPVKVVAEAAGFDKATRGTNPGFHGLAGADFGLHAAPAGWTPAPLASEVDAAALLPTMQYAREQHGAPRPATPIVPGGLVE